jgi:hypothetical protein
MEPIRHGLKNRAHLFGAARPAISQVLIEYARAKRAKKRDHQAAPLQNAAARCQETAREILEIRGLGKMECINPLWGGL